MYVVLIFCMLFLVISIYVGVFVYDRKIGNDKNKILKLMWDKTSNYDERAGVPITRLELIQECDMDYNRFSIIIGKLLDKRFIEADKNTVSFTQHGVHYYDFAVLAKQVKR